ncbi:hypothetical protein OOZ15_04115 [Galbibacter sp. EGI 63066]|uniref:hypothetical protein n=1 Tax=Galbibacter sp. EGI 63066 TaxID=2993559 RepID=UPI0022489783|nr:hypothetical protein [Galbibacter sp. EGI 63066]MCX2679117.1 hypothetical protein [Galbibacter sp. EGI 63066]
MKKLLLITLLLSFASNAQEFEFDSIVNYNSDKDISKEAEKILASNAVNLYKTNREIQGFVSGKSKRITLLSEEKQENTGLSYVGESEVIASAMYKYEGTQMGCIRVMFINYDISLKFKEDRYKIELSNYNYSHYNNKTSDAVQVYGMKDVGPCRSKNSIEDFINNCKRCKRQKRDLVEYLTKDAKETIKTIASEMDERLNEDDW